MGYRLLVEKSFGLPTLTSSVHELCLNFQKCVGESSHLFPCIIFSAVKRQDGKVVKHKHVRPVCSLCGKIKLHSLHLVRGLVLLDA